ncbi:hypothetical protein HYPSUDRAFT_954953 [Hypholoma sublateritium FD-334 SS-4]|uniref:Uncharacterized protein n=1 Tax=Hypholoma sublateritium (strain FD-334 SS-4) TaxID=945553 RepID=A0A0D2M5P5_HYPSF|nr:hypothetical protein HYPSUDRAFT_954953 [Hypholoma sublateritium FD-334 SS-4]
MKAERPITPMSCRSSGLTPPTILSSTVAPSSTLQVLNCIHHQHHHHPSGTDFLEAKLPLRHRLTEMMDNIRGSEEAPWPPIREKNW